MSDAINSVYDFQEIDILAKLILGKKTLDGLMTLWREKDAGLPEKNCKQPFRINIINDGSVVCASPLPGSPVKSVKLCKRTIVPGYPKNTLILPHKTKISYRYALSLLVEYENGAFNVLTLPKQLSIPSVYTPAEVMSFFDACTGQNSPVDFPIHHKSDTDETLTVTCDETNGQRFFEYGVILASTDLFRSSSSLELEEQNLQSFVQTKNLKLETEIREQAPVHVDHDLSVWTTAVDISLFEDIILKIGIDQDIVVHGVPGS